MIVNLLIGFPDQRPGGLLLSVLSAVGSGVGALLLGIVYATVCVQVPRLSLALQATLAVLRGVPLLLLVFMLAQTTRLSLPAAGFVALLLYSLSQVGEALRGFLAAYPSAVRDQARLLGLSWGREWIELRLPWSLRRSLEALATHWISLLKDTGALTVLGIGELTTVARALSERASISDWQVVIGAAALLYLGATITLTRALDFLRTRYALGGAVST
jgi:polar amino acid transport system permease protein